MANDPNDPDDPANWTEPGEDVDEDGDEEAGFGDVASDAADAFEEVDEAAQRQDAGQPPVSVTDDEDEDEPHTESLPPPRRATPIRPAARQAAAIAEGGGPPPPPPAAPAAPRVNAGVQINRPVKDGETGEIIGYEVLDSAGSVIEEYMVDASGNRLPGQPWWLAEENVSVTTINPPDDNQGLKMALAGLGGTIAGWFFRGLWDDHKKNRDR